MFAGIYRIIVAIIFALHQNVSNVLGGTFSSFLVSCMREVQEVPLRLNVVKSR